MPLGLFIFREGTIAHMYNIIVIIYFWESFIESGLPLEGTPDLSSEEKAENTNIKNNGSNIRIHRAKKAPGGRLLSLWGVPSLARNCVFDVLVPEGVGPMTVAMLCKNTVNLARHSIGLDLRALVVG